LLDLDTMIMDWRDSLPAHLRYDPSSAENGGQDGAHIPPEGSTSARDFSAQARRLHARFLHVRILILRPALEQLFQEQRHAQSNGAAQTRPSPRGARVARVQDLILSEIAAQCVLSADSLARCLDMHIRAQNLVAWWYNISCKYYFGAGEKGPSALTLAPPRIRPAHMRQYPSDGPLMLL
jgi:hypothetical protein